MDLVVLVGSAIGLLASWIVLSCLIMVLRARFSRDAQADSDQLSFARSDPGAVRAATCGRLAAEIASASL